MEGWMDVGRALKEGMDERMDGWGDRYVYLGLAYSSDKSCGWKVNLT